MLNYKLLLKILFLSLIFNYDFFSQIGATIPSNRRINWTKAGYNRSPLDNIPTKYADIYQMPPPSAVADSNSKNIVAALNWASTKKGLICIQFQKGTYNIISSIVLGGCCHSNIVLKGKGPQSTIVNYIGPRNNTNSVIRCGGYVSSNPVRIKSYNKLNNSITLENNSLQIHSNDYILVRAFNGPWQDDSIDIANNWQGGPARDYLGQIIRVSVIEGNKLTLTDDLSLTWSILENHFPYIKKLSSHPNAHSAAPTNIGIQDLKVTSNGAISHFGTHIMFYGVANCWVKNVESIKPYRNHIGISVSTAIEIRNSYFFDADSIGVGGFGYGVNIDGTSTNNLIENNIFNHLRHSVVIHMGANRNVIGYNYSFEEYSGYSFYLGDFQVHGHYPYANLFEGNWGDRFYADNYWGKNGPYNTFIRNFSYKNDFIIQSSNNFNVLGNEFKLTKTSSDNLIDIYGFETKKYLDTQSTQNLLLSQSYFHNQNDTNLKKFTCLEDISYYHTSRPDFISSNDFTWPPIGPPLCRSGSSIAQNIPARNRHYYKLIQMILQKLIFLR